MSSEDRREGFVRPALAGVVTGFVAVVIAVVAGFLVVPHGGPGVVTPAAAKAAVFLPAAAADPKPEPPSPAYAAPAASVAALSQVPVGFFASDWCRYYQGQDGNWYSDVCVRTVQGAQQWGYQPNVGAGQPAAAFLALFDVTEPQFTTVRFPNEAPFSTNQNLGWVRTYPAEPGRVDWLIRNNLDGQLHWLTTAQLQEELRAGHGPNWGFTPAPSGSAPGTAPGVTPGSAAANPANTAALTGLSVRGVDAMTAPQGMGLGPRCTIGAYCF